MDAALMSNSRPTDQISKAVVCSMHLGCCPDNYGLVEGPQLEVQEICTLPAMVGDCADYIQRWFFDTTKKRCRLFYYGGCGGNKNNFYLESKCENRCSDQLTTATVRLEPLQPETELTIYKERSDGVRGPAGIAGLPDVVVIGELGQPLRVRCMAYGYPQPSIWWYHGRNGPMVPYSSVQYEARDNVLQIRKLSIETLGEYICETNNGIGKPVDWSITVKAYRTDDLDDSIYLVSRQNEVLITSLQAQTEDTTTISPEIVPVYTVPVTTRIVSERTRLAAGSELNLRCEVDGYPVPEVYWTKNSAAISSDDRITVTETRLTVSRTNTNDTDEYSCHAFNSFTSLYSSVKISVKGPHIRTKCKDSPTLPSAI